MLKVKNLSKTFGSIQALTDINFEIEEGEFVFLTGPSGAGKTTLIRLIIRELIPDSGEIILDNDDIVKISKKQVPLVRQQIGVIFQDFKVLPERTVKENIEVALAIIGLHQKEWDERIGHVLGLVGLTDRSHLFPSQLSGGELQRASMARALVINPKILIADEPTGNLDWVTSEKLMQLFDTINKEGKTIIMSSHNEDIINRMKKRVIVLDKGRLKHDSDSKKESDKPKSDKKTEPKKDTEDLEEKSEGDEKKD